jgi:hypothetical protein
MITTTTFKTSLEHLSAGVRRLTRHWTRAQPAPAAPQPQVKVPGVFGLLAGIDRTNE